MAAVDVLWAKMKMKKKMKMKMKMKKKKKSKTFIVHEDKGDLHAA